MEEEKEGINKEEVKTSSKFDSLSMGQKRVLYVNSILIGFLVVLTLALVGVGIWYFAFGGEESKKQEALEGARQEGLKESGDIVDTLEKKKVAGDVNKGEWFGQWLRGGNGFVFTKEREEVSGDLLGGGEDAYFYDLKNEKEKFLGSIKGLWKDDFVTDFENGGFGLAILSENGDLAPYFKRDGEKEGDALVGFENVLEYSFSPDGEQVIYTTTDNYIKIRNYRTGEIKDLGQHEAGINFGEEETKLAKYSSPSWSPDGRYIAFQKELETQEEAQIYTTVYVGGGERGIVVLPISAKSMDEAFEVGRSYIVESEGLVNFDWSEKGNFLIDGISRSIYDVSKREVVRQGDKEDWQDIDLLKISPDEKQVLYINTKEKSMYFVGIKGKNRVELLELEPGDLYSYSADWSSDGKKIVYSDGIDIFIYNLDKKEKVTVLRGGVSISDVKWSFGDDTIGYSENGDVWMIKLSTES